MTTNGSHRATDLPGLRWNLRLPGFIVLLTAILVHTLMGAILCVSARPLLTVPTAIPLTYLSRGGAALAYLLVAWAALEGLRRPGRIGLYLTIPQMALFYAATISAVIAVVTSTYPDGVARHGSFIFVDHALTIVFALAHGAAIVVYHGSRWTTPRS